MKINNKYGVLQIIISYILLWIPMIIEEISKKENKDIYFLCFMISVLVMVDAKMKYNNLWVKINYWIICILFITNFVILML